MKKYLGLQLVVILGLLPLIPLLYPGLPFTHDGQDHVARIANFYQSLSEGNIIPRWADNLNWGYGHPILMFLYPFPSYFSSFFHMIGFSLVDSVKMVFGVSYVLSGVGMYLWIKNMWGEKAGFVSAAIYMYAPYRFVDLYVRGAIGEHVAFLFAPFICYFIFKLSQKYSYAYFLGLSTAITGLLLSHNAIAIMFLPIIILYALSLHGLTNKKFLGVVSAGFFIGFGLSSFFLFPAFFEGKYTLRDTVTSGGEYKNAFVPFFAFFNLQWSFGVSPFLSKQIGIPILVSFFVSLFYAFRLKKNAFLFFVFGASFLIAFFLMLSISNFIWEHITLLQKFQFPWRFLSVLVFSGSVLGGLCISYIKNKKLQNVFFTVLVFSTLILSAPYIKTNGHIQKPHSFFSGIYKSTTDTGESAPIWSVRFMEREANMPVEVIEGKGDVLNYKKDTTSREYTINAQTNVRIRENTLYFPNWEVYVNGKKTAIEYQDPLNRGLITFFTPPGKSQVQILFSDTKLRILANWLSIGSVILLILILFLPKKLVKYGS